MQKMYFSPDPATVIVVGVVVLVVMVGIIAAVVYMVASRNSGD